MCRNDRRVARLVDAYLLSDNRSGAIVSPVTLCSAMAPSSLLVLICRSAGCGPPLGADPLP